MHVIDLTVNDSSMHIWNNSLKPCQIWKKASGIINHTSKSPYMLCI